MFRFLFGLFLHLFVFRAEEDSIGSSLLRRVLTLGVILLLVILVLPKLAEEEWHLMP